MMMTMVIITMIIVIRVTIISRKVLMIFIFTVVLSPLSTTPQNGQTLLNNSSSTADEIV